MAGRFTRKMYDGCAYQQDTKQSTDPLEMVLDVTKYVHCNNICRPSEEYPPNAALLVDVESSLWGIDKLASDCDSAKHPFCGPNGCLLTNDARVPPHITPYACERGKENDNAVITTNMTMPTDPGFRVPDTSVCQDHRNGYYVDPNRIPMHQASPGFYSFAPRPPHLLAPIPAHAKAPLPPHLAPRPKVPFAPHPKAPLPPYAKAPLVPHQRAPLVPYPKAPLPSRAKTLLAPYLLPIAPRSNNKPIGCMLPPNNNNNHLLY